MASSAVSVPASYFQKEVVSSSVVLPPKSATTSKSSTSTTCSDGNTGLQQNPISRREAARNPKLNILHHLGLPRPKKSDSDANCKLQVSSSATNSCANSRQAVSPSQVSSAIVNSRANSCSNPRQVLASGNQSLFLASQSPATPLSCSQEDSETSPSSTNLQRASSTTASLDLAENSSCESSGNAMNEEANVPPRRAFFCKVHELRPESVGVNLVLKVNQVLDSYEVVADSDDDQNGFVRQVDCSVGDETGCINLSLRNLHVQYAVPGKTLIVRNGNVVMRSGYLHLEVGHWGKLSSSPEAANFSVNSKVNISAIEYDFITIAE